MIIVDTSVWVDHFRSANGRLAVLASQVDLLQHPYVTGELAMGNLRGWRQVVDHLGRLPQAHPTSHMDMLDFVERHHLMGTGIGLVDAHLLSCAATFEHTLWTRDRRLAVQAETAFHPGP